MDEYIKREDAKRILAEDYAYAAATLLDDVPAADVTQVQRWIPVEERKPNLIPCNAGTGYSEAVIVLTSGRKVMCAICDGIDWFGPFGFWDAWDEEITHWMPLPDLPKEDA